MREGRRRESMLACYYSVLLSLLEQSPSKRDIESDLKYILRATERPYIQSPTFVSNQLSYFGRCILHWCSYFYHCYMQTVISNRQEKTCRNCCEFTIPDTQLDTFMRVQSQILLSDNIFKSNTKFTFDCSFPSSPNLLDIWLLETQLLFLFQY